MNTRIYSILKRLSLEDRLVSVANPGNYYDKIETDYSKANVQMAEFIEESKDFIKKSLADKE